LKIIFATSNLNKVKEINQILPDGYEIVSLSDIGWHDEIPETSNTIQGNAIMKAQYLFDHLNKSCFAEDTGLEVEALNGEPGVYSARYAGDHRSDKDNIKKLLNNLQNQTNRKAQFRTVIAFHDGTQMHTFEGIAKGNIIQVEKGVGGFGYDPIFQSEGSSQTFAEMESSQKSEISHRAKAFKKFMAFIRSKDQLK